MRSRMRILIVLLVGFVVFVGEQGFCAPGDLDTSFGNGGWVQTDFYSGESGYDTQGTGIALQGEKAIIVGYDTFYGEVFITRRLKDGTNDYDFGNGGRVLVPVPLSGERLQTVAVDTDNSIVAAGQTSNGEVLLVKLTAEGSLDTSFDSDGIMVLDPGTDAYEIHDIALLSGGSILVAGAYTHSGETDFVVLKFTSGGSLDTSFGTSGKAVVDVLSQDTAAAMAVQPDGKIVLVGTTVPGTSFLAVARLNTDGSPDTTFNGGSGTYVLGGYVHSEGTAVLTDSSAIYIAGHKKDSPVGDLDFIVGKMNLDGSFDTSFGSNGIRVVPQANWDDHLCSLQRLSGDLLQAIGYSTDATRSRIFEARINTDGSMATGYGSNGLSFPQAGSDNELLVATDGAFYTAAGYAYLTGTFTTGDITKVLFFRESILSSNVSNMVGFAPLKHSAMSIHDISVMPNGTIAAAGDGAVASAICSYSASGVYDPDSRVLYDYPRPWMNTVTTYQNNYAFVGGSYEDNAYTIRYGPDDYTITQAHTFGSSALFTCSALSQDKPVFAGYSDGKIILMRLLHDLSPDPSFGGDGYFTHTGLSIQAVVRGMVVQPDGKILVTGYDNSSGSCFVSRYLSTGAVDTSFGDNGIYIHYLGGNDKATDIVLQSDGKIMVCGLTNTRMLLFRLTADGALDTSFATNGNYVDETKYGLIKSMAVQSDDKPVMVGDYGVSSSATIWRFTADGALDTSFGNGGIVQFDAAEAAGFETVTVLSDGSILAAGSAWNEYTAQADFMVAKFHGGSAPSSNSAPTAENDVYTVTSGQSTLLSVLDNDSDPDGDAVSIHSVGAPSHGTAVINGDRIEYQSTAAYTGPDSFAYTISDGKGGTDTATVAVTVIGSGAGTPLDITGWWYTPGQGGSGLSMDISDDGSLIFLAWYAYDDSGQSVWYVSWAERQGTADIYKGNLMYYTGPYNQPAVDGTITLDFASADSASLSWNMSTTRSNPGSKTITKYLKTLDPGTDDPLDFNGWYTDSANHPATGVFVELKGSTVYVGWYHYRDNGKPIWKVMGGFLDPQGFNSAQGSYSAVVTEYMYGQTITGAYKAAVEAATYGYGFLLWDEQNRLTSFSNGATLYTLSPYPVTKP